LVKENNNIIFPNKLSLVELLKDVDQEFTYLSIYLLEKYTLKVQNLTYFSEKISTKVFTKITRISHPKKKKMLFVDLHT
jgi:hypothetical protein